MSGRIKPESVDGMTGIRKRRGQPFRNWVENMKIVLMCLLLIGAAKPPLMAQSASDSARALTSVIKLGQFVAIHASTNLKGRVREVTDTSILLVGARAVNVSGIKSVEVRIRKTPSTGVGVVIGGLLGGAAGYIFLGLSDTPKSETSKIVGTILLSSVFSGFFGGVIGSSIHHVDTWETVWSR